MRHWIVRCDVLSNLSCIRCDFYPVPSTYHKEKERETQLRLKKIKLRERELAMQVKIKELEVAAASTMSPTPGSSDFDVSKHVRFVPPFQETEVDKYFLHFEKVASSLAWPKEVWTLLLQSALLGKAREAYSALSVDQSSDYDIVKSAALRAYELVPEAYRQKFRSSRKNESQTYVEFAQDKESLVCFQRSSEGVW